MYFFYVLRFYFLISLYFIVLWFYFLYISSLLYGSIKAITEAIHKWFWFHFFIFKYRQYLNKFV